MKVAPTGNGRRESFAHLPMPRMTNTIMLAGSHDPAEILASVADGKGATLIGNGPETMQKVAMIGHDMKLDDGVGVCGKDGQSVPVGVGQPSLLISELTVGGTRAG